LVACQTMRPMCHDIFRLFCRNIRQVNQPTGQRVDNLWLQAGTELVLPLPSALINHTTNYMINAAHPQAATHLAETLVEPFWIDPRFVR
jgi:RES domain-containing protein